MDTNVLVAAFRSRRGASFELLQRLRRGEWTTMLSNHLLYEYEELLRRDDELRLSSADVDSILNFVCARGEEWPLTPGWTPVLPDANDEPWSNWHMNPEHCCSSASIRGIFCHRKRLGFGS